MLLSETYLETQTHELLMTFLVAMAPVIELRGAIPAGIASGLPPALACTAAIAGNLVPAPFIILLGRRVASGAGDSGGGPPAGDRGLDRGVGGLGAGYPDAPRPARHLPGTGHRRGHYHCHYAGVIRPADLIRST